MEGRHVDKIEVDESIKVIIRQQEKVIMQHIALALFEVAAKLENFSPQSAMRQVAEELAEEARQKP
jgi:hypothetical protein